MTRAGYHDALSVYLYGGDSDLAVMTVRTRYWCETESFRIEIIPKVLFWNCSLLMLII